MRQKIQSFVVVFCVCFLVRHIFCDVILLRNNLNASCFPEEDNLVAYLAPPNVQPKRDNDFVDDVVVENDDWVPASTNESITDSRWREFQSTKSNHSQFSFNETISFSVYAPFSFKLNIIYIIQDDNPYPRSHTCDLIKNFTTGWFHFTLLQKNQSLILYENGKLVKNISHKWESDISSGQKNVTIANSNETFWKIHNLKFRWSNTTTHSEPTILKTYRLDISCLSMYYYLCENCFLEVNSTTLGETYNFTKNKNQTKLWNNSKIKLKCGKENVIAIYRRIVGNDDVNGTWGLDIRYCRNFQDSIVRKNISHGEKISCKILNEEEIAVNTTTVENHELCERPGKLGINCMHNCSEVLGPYFPYCERHKICRNSNCSCAWGFRGDQCDTDCDDRTYGLNCSRKCENCEKCDKITGKCPSPDVSATSAYSIIILVVAILVIISFVCYVFRKRIQTWYNNFCKGGDASEPPQGELSMPLKPINTQDSIELL
ncbi:uncharacterized protein LOC135138804 [Zophobas morio]|uniref:uncharacterized protein LOC135138804 n=1 Tax=Zophobas morio TaxID=2755281 RepID=UPI003082CD4E